MNDTIPTIGEHRGVPLHDCQSPERLDVVRQDIDAVHEMSDVMELFDAAGDAGRAPEARLLAAAKLEAALNLAAERREVRPPVDIGKVRASVAGLDSQNWRDPARYCSLLDAEHERAVPRDSSEDRFTAATSKATD